MPLTKGNKDREEQSHDDPNPQRRRNPGEHRPRINLMGERVDRVWADPILTPRRETAR